MHRPTPSAAPARVPAQPARPDPRAARPAQPEPQTQQLALPDPHPLDAIDPDDALTPLDVAVLLGITGQIQARGEVLDQLARVRSKLKAAIKNRQAFQPVDADGLVAEHLADQAEADPEVEKPATAETPKVAEVAPASPPG